MTIVLCPRCSQPCRISDKEPNPNARPLRLSKSPKAGLCANCAFTAFLYSIETLMAGISRNGTIVLQNPQIQQSFAQLFHVGQSDADIHEIDWITVIENWDLPFPNRKRNRRDA